MRHTISRWIVGLALGGVCGPILVAAEPVAHVAQTEFFGKKSFTLTSPQVTLAVTEIGGHMAPVTFYRQAQKFEPYHISPWQKEPPAEMPVPVLVPLRGDFFCMPFGGNADPVHGEKHPPHGEVAGSNWKLVGVQEKTGRNQAIVHTLTMQMETSLRKGHVTKQLSLVDDQNVVYSSHTIEGFAGRVPLGHHATLAMPESEESVHLASSPLRFGMTYPGQFSDPKQREYQSLLPGTRWTDPTQVPVLAKNAPDADITRQPARYGHADLVQLVNDPSVAGPAWMTATFTGGEQEYVWFSLKDPTVLSSTVIWMEHHGRHGHPWNGRNSCLGLEDVTAFFADGLAASSGKNILTQEGVPTAVELQAEHPTVIRYIQGVAAAPKGFDRVTRIEFVSGGMVLVSPKGERVTVAVVHEFLKTGTL